MISYTVTVTETQTVYDIKSANICLGPCRNAGDEGYGLKMRPREKDRQFHSLLVSLCMGLHPRLGRDSPLQILQDDVLERISSILLSSLFVEKKRWDLKPHDGGSYTLVYPFEGEAYGYAGPQNVFRGMRICYRCDHRYQEQARDMAYSENGYARVSNNADMARDCIRIVEKLEQNATRAPAARAASAP